MDIPLTYLILSTTFCIKSGSLTIYFDFFDISENFYSNHLIINYFYFTIYLLLIRYIEVKIIRHFNIYDKISIQKHYDTKSIIITS